MSSIYEIKQKYQNKLDSLDIELIIAFVIKKSREFILAHPEYIVESRKSKVESQIKRRISEEPLAYILGGKEFYGLDFKVNKNTLVPRPETELMVDEALKIIEQETCLPDRQAKNKEHGIIIDAGTGSGCIIITLANLINLKLKISNFQFLATDISAPALKVARQNAKIHKTNKQITFLHGNLLEPIFKNKKYSILDAKYIILANLPYLTPTQIKNSPSIKKEPQLALVAGKDGLKYYRELFKQINLLNISGFVLCEIDPLQTKPIKRIIKDNFPSSQIEIKKDLSGQNRIVIININN